MLDSALRPLIDPPLDRMSVFLVRLGASANGLTAAGVIAALFCFGALAYQAYGIAFGFLCLNRVFDGLDGAVARRRGPTDLGGYFDSVADFLFYGGVIFFFAVGRPETALSAVFLLFSVLASGSSFLAYAAISAKRGGSEGGQGPKSFYYVNGLMEGSETILVYGLMCLFPLYFEWLAWGFGALCWLTAIGRLRRAIRTFGSNNHG